MAIFQPEGRIELISDVDIDLSYTHQYYFENITAQNNFFASKVTHTLENGTYQRKNLGTIQIGYQADTIANVKYLRWQNPQYSNKWYYAFVLGIDYVNPGVSNIRYELDVYQTFLFNMEWKQSFIEREHTTRFINNKPVINTIPENLEYGSEYDTSYIEKITQLEDVAWAILGCTKGSSPSYSIKGLATNIGYYIVPVYTGKTYNDVNFKGDVSISSFKDILNAFRTNSSLVNSLVSCIIIPFLPFNNLSITKDGSTWKINYPAYTLNIANIVAGTSLRAFCLANNPNYQIFEYISNFTKYSKFPNYEESKLYMYPYSFMELTTLRGDSTIIKLEYVNNDAITIGVLGTINFINKMGYIVKGYLGNASDYQREYILVDNSNDNVPIVDDYTASYIQSNSNSIAVAQSNARLLQQTSTDNLQRTYSTAMENAYNTGIMGAIQGAGQIGAGLLNMLSGGGGGQVVSGFTDIITNEIAYENAKRTAETNKLNSLNSVKTDFATSIANIMAKKRDAEQIPATARSLGGSYLFNNMYDCNTLYCIYKTIKSEYADKLTSYFKQYGYKVNKLEVPAFHTRTSWNYIKMTEPNVYGDIPMDDLMKIRDIFMKGITLWHGDYIGDYSRTNNEVIYYGK